MYRLVFVIFVIASSALADAPPDLVDLPTTEVVVEDVRATTNGPPESALGTGTADVIAPQSATGSGASLADLVSQAPGVQLRRSGTLGTFTTLSLRGTGSDNVAFVLDDVVLGSATLGAIDLSLVPVQDLERVEVYRGTGPVRFNNPLGGVVVLTSRVPQKNLELRGHLGYGAFGTLSAGAAAGGPLVKTVRARLALAYDGTQGNYVFYDNRYTETNTADDRLQRRHNNFFQQGAAKLNVEADGPWQATWRLDANAKLSNQGVPGTRLVAAKHTRAQQQEYVARIALNEAVAWQERLRLYVDASAVLSQRQFLDPANEAGLQVGSTTSRLWQAALDGRIMLLSALTHETELAPRVTLERFVQTGTVNRAGERGTQLWRALATAGLEHRADLTQWLRVVPSVRGELVRDNGSTTVMQAQASPRIGAIAFFDPCELRANVGRHHRFPTVLERYGDNATVSSSLDLKPETGWATDTGLSCKVQPAFFKSVEASLGSFWVSANNLIVLVKNSAFFLNAENLGAATSGGIEARVQASALYGAAQASYTFTDTRNREPGIGQGVKRIPGEPLHRLMASVGIGPESARLTYEAQYTGQSFLDTPNNQEVPARLLHHLAGELALPWQDLVLKASAHNLTNVRAVNVALRDATGGVGVAPLLDFTGYPLPGRSWFVSLLWRPQ